MRVSRIAVITLASLVSLVFWGGQAEADPVQRYHGGVQKNRIIYAGDYDIFKVGRRQGWGACQRACNGDPRCRAWTFIRFSRQCRLKYQTGQSVRNNCCVSGLKRRVVDGGVDHGDGRGQTAFCVKYAAQSVQAQVKNLRERCGFRGARWNVNFARHYQFCMRVSRRESNAETLARKDMIESCVSHGAGDQHGHAGNIKRKRCDHYARIAVAQSRTNNKAGCGFRGRIWTTDRRTHVRACRNSNWTTSRDRTNRRESRIRECLGLR